MINLNFTEKELETLKEYFQSELYKAEQKIDDIRGILGKIGKKFGKVQKTLKKTEKRGRKKSAVTEKLKTKPVAEKKRPGRKPKAIKEAEIAAETKILKKRGRPFKVKPEEKVTPKATIKGAKTKTQKLTSAKVVKPIDKRTKAAKVKEPAAKVTRATGKGIKVSKEKPVRTIQSVKEKPLKVAKVKPQQVKVGKTVSRKPVKVKKDIATAVTKAETAATPELTAVRVRRPRIKTEKPIVVKAEKKKVTHTPKVPWRDWVLAALRDTDNNLSQEQIIAAIAQKLQLSGEELTASEKKIKEQLVKLISARKIIPNTDANGLTAYSIKITGKGL